jgi:type III restriction enzyme
VAQKDKILFWVKNLVRKEGCSFFFQKANGRFYPDFICKLSNDVTLVVEYKGDRWSEAQDDHNIGGLWEEMSDNKFRFVMVRDKKWEWIAEKLSSVS